MAASNEPTHTPAAQMEAPTGPGTGKTLRRRVLLMIVLAGCCVFFLPISFFNLPGFGIEASWRLTLNKAFSEGWAFGDRLIWTYGPLGILETRYPYGVSPWFYGAFDLVVLVLFLRMALDAMKLDFDAPLAWAGIATLFTCKRLIHDQPSTALYVLLIYLFARNLSRPGLMTSTALLVISTTNLFYKMNFGLVGFVLCAGIFLFKALARERAALPWLVLAVLHVPLAWLAATWFHTNPLHYVKSSLTLARHYGDAMAWSMGPGTVSHWVVCLLFWGYVAMAVVLVKRQGVDRTGLLYLLVSAAALFVLYKTSVIRSDYNHNKNFLLGFPIIALTFLIYSPPSLSRFWRRLFMLSTIYTSLVMVAEFGNSLIYMQAEYLEYFFPINYVKGIKQYHIQKNWSAYVDAVGRAFPERTVPMEGRRIVGTNRVDVFPFESTLALGSGLNYWPRPVPQTYAVLGQDLEERNLAFFESTNAPRFVLYVLGDRAYSTDGRYSLWDEPAVKRFLQQHYVERLAFTNIQGAPPEIDPGASPILLLERNPEAKGSAPVALGTKVQRAGEPFALPFEESELYAEIRIRKALLGRLASFLYRGGPVSVTFTLENGAEKQFRVVPANLKTGVLVNYFADGTDAESTRNYLCHHSRGNTRCLKLRIDYGRRWEYDSEFEVSYFR